MNSLQGSDRRVDLNRAALCALLILFVLFCLAPCSRAGAPAKQKPAVFRRVLILNSHDFDIPWQRIVDRNLIDAFDAVSNPDILIFVEYTALSQHSDTVYKQHLENNYRYKYKDGKPDLIVAVDIPATNFLLNRTDDLFADTPVVFISEADNYINLQLKPNVTGIVTDIDPKGTVDAALALHPGTRNIALISGSSEVDRLYEGKVRKALEGYADRYKVIDLTGLTMEALLSSVSRLPDHTIALYVLTLKDAHGHAFVPQKAVAGISRASRAPVYGLWDTLLGQGIVGGHLSGAEMAGREAAGMGLRILKGTAPAKIPVATADNAYLFDWRELRRWGLDEDDLVKGSQVRYKNLTFFGIYKWYIIGFTLLAVLESVLLVILLVQRARRRRAERALQKAKDELELRVELRTADLQQANQRLVDEIGVRKKAEAALQVETRNLQRALSEIKTLSGMLPICASCKKIRDDKGYWNQIESYIKEHSEASFSHAICPECAKKLYPDLV